MSCEINHSVMGQGQCSYPRDCCQCCGSGDSSPASALTLASGAVGLPHGSCLSNSLVTTCARSCDEDFPNRSNFDFGLGPNMLCYDWPYMADQVGASPRPVVAVLPPMAGLWFDNDGSNYSARGHAYTLTYDGTFHLTAPDGRRWTFQGFDPEGPRGRFSTFSTPGGYSAVVQDYTASAHPTEILATIPDGQGGYVYESYLYDYIAGVDGQDNGIERLNSTTIRHKIGNGDWQVVGVAQYEYEGQESGSSGSGSAYLGGLQRILYQEAGSSEWKVLAYHRNYPEDEESALSGAVKFTLGAAEYLDLAADPEVEDPLAVSDEKLAEYAAEYFEYDGNGWVSKKKTRGGTVEHNYTYLDYTGLFPGCGHWQRKTTIAGPGNSQTIEYVDYVGNLILRQVTVDGETTREYWQYDGSGNLTQHANSAAITDVYHPTTSTGQLLVILSSTSGLIRYYTYYTTTTTGSGGTAVANYKEYEKDQHGTNGATQLTVRKFEYTQRQITVDGVTSTIYPVLHEIVYPNTDGSSPYTIGYSYSWFADTLQMQERVTTWPAVAAGHNGSGSTTTRTERFDQRGNLIWLKDERGAIDYHQYDLLTGNLVQSIRDVDGNQLALPGGWSTPNGGGLHLVTDYSYDDQGRLVETLGAAHDVNGTMVRTAEWTAYSPLPLGEGQGEGGQGEGLATRAARGYRSGTSPNYSYTLVNPVLDRQAGRRRADAGKHPGRVERHAGRVPGRRRRGFRTVVVRPLVDQPVRQPRRPGLDPRVSRHSRQRRRLRGHELRRDRVRLRRPGPAEHAEDARRHDRPHGLRRPRAERGPIRGHR